MSPRLLSIVFTGLVAGAILAFLTLPGLRQGSADLAVGKQTTGKALVGGPFKLTDHTGKAVTDADYRGRYMLVYFGYTYCPDVCPAGLQVISAALDQLGDKAQRVAPLFITLDPARDTPAKLAEYVGSFNPRIIGLTGSAEETAAVAKAYRVYSKKIADEKSPGSYTLDHTSIIYLMDPQGEFVTHFTHLTNVDQLAAQLRKVLEAR